MKNLKAMRSMRTLVLGSVLAVAISGLGAAAAQADTTEPTPSDTPSASASSDAPSTAPSDDASSPAPSDRSGDGSSSDPTTEPTQPPATKQPAAPKQASSRNYCAQLDGCVTVTNNVYFNYPFSGNTNRYRLRNLITKMINNVPGGYNENDPTHRNRIRIAQFSVNDDALVNALIRARKRGVSVQVVVDSHNVHGTKNFGSSPSFIRLARTLKGYRGNTSSCTSKNTSYRISHCYKDVSWARYCVKSCRGSGGDVHYKMVLMTNVARSKTTSTPWVTVMGSPNLTLLAAQGQWNHQNVYVDRKPGHKIFANYDQRFVEMARDRRANPTYVQSNSSYTNPAKTQGSVLTYFYPKASNASNDPGMLFFAGVRCTGAASGYGIGGRTVIRIGQYAWYETRGQWFAKRVRQLWDQGCNVAIETSVMGNTVKKILTSSRGRGRIPIKQIGTQDRHGKWLTYDHAKWVTISGNVYSNGKNHPKTVKVTQGTTNWSNLALSSDDFMQQFKYDGSVPATGVTGSNWSGTRSTLYSRFYSNFRAIWSGPRSHGISPASRIPGDLGGPNAKLGQGKYANMEVG